VRALAALLVLTACASPPAPAASVAEQAPAGWRARAELERERELGRQVDARLATQLGFYGERRVASYVESVGRELARGATRREIDHSFKIVDAEAVNAFAAPGGYIYVTRGLLAQLASEAELAAVLAHELAHVDSRHSLRDAAWEELRDAAWTRADTLRFYERSRDHEREADQLAVQSLARLGYDPAALGAAFQRLGSAECEADAEDDSDPRGWLSSHPTMAARIARALHAANRQAGRVGRERHLAAIDGLAFGPNPRHGYLVGSSWVVPSARLAFELPNGWQAHADASTLWVTARDQSGFMLLMRSGREPALESGAWSLELEVAGRAARWMAIDTDSGHRGSLASIELDSQQQLLLMAAVPSASSTELDQPSRRFRRVSDPRLLGRRSLRLVIARPARQTSLARLARGQPVSLETLVRLNGLAAEAPIAPGTPVKLIAR
jgi:predicted Zn-dependent protease